LIVLLGWRQDAAFAALAIAATVGIAGAAAIADPGRATWRR